MSNFRTEAQKAEHAANLGEDTNVIGVGRVNVLPPVRDRFDEDRLSGLIDRFSTAYRHFSHIWTHPVTLGLMEKHHEVWQDAVACVAPKNQIVFVKPNHGLSYRTVFHELAHLEIHARNEAGEDLPTSSEDFCDIYAMARMPPELVDTEEFAYLGEPSIPKEEWPGVCRRALEYRERHRDYIKQCKRWLKV